VATLVVSTPAYADSQLWLDIDPAQLAVEFASDFPLTGASRTLHLDLYRLRDGLGSAPLEGSPHRISDELKLAIPIPSGGYARFRVVESPIMEEGLRTSYPEIRTYRGQGVDDPNATLRFDVTPHGFHAAIWSSMGTIYIDPYTKDDPSLYRSYFTRDLAPRPDQHRTCGVTERYTSRSPGAEAGTGLSSGSQLREYRIAVAATGEYTSFHGGTVEDGMAAIVTAMNRVNGIYERDVAIRMNLVAGNDAVVYTNPALDPYSNSNGVTMLSQNQATLDAVIGSANYDIGHVFGTGGGGVASLAVTCKNGSKARGVTGLSAPTGDFFWVDFVSHELGHQWGGNHTFNGSAGSCSGGNRNSSTAYEPGSGSTVMAYAGICGSQNLQSTSDDYFHGVSFDEIVAYSAQGFGDTCAETSATGNEPPAVDPGEAHTIPISTPFELCGSATDPDGDPITFSWEQFDTGPAGSPNSPSGDAPIFRSFPASDSACRTFPKLDDLLNNTQTIGEILPTYDRTMHFRLTAKDNRSGAGGVDYDQTTVVTASSGAGPFLVTSPNTAVIWEAGTHEAVVWDTANTVDPPISCEHVDIWASVDGGVTYPYPLALGTSNDGSETVSVSGLIPPSSSVRLKVACSTSVFFDISDVDFQVDDSDVLFADSFESGDRSVWSDTVP
jgi:hypothetical protein